MTTPYIITFKTKSQAWNVLEPVLAVISSIWSRAANLIRLCVGLLLCTRDELTVRIGTEGGETFTVRSSASIVVGRDIAASGSTPCVDLSPLDPCSFVSRRHCTFHIFDGRLAIVDCGTTNGTFVNQTRLTPGISYPLMPGDFIQIGPEITFEVIKG